MSAARHARVGRIGVGKLERSRRVCSADAYAASEPLPRLAASSRAARRVAVRRGGGSTRRVAGALGARQGADQTTTSAAGRWRSRRIRWPRLGLACSRRGRLSERRDGVSGQGHRWSGRVAMTARAYWRARIAAAGALPCWRCGRPLTVSSKWTVGHLVDRAAGGSVSSPSNQWPECAHCNYSAGGKLGAARRNARRVVASPVRGSERARGIRGW